MGSIATLRIGRALGFGVVGKRLFGLRYAVCAGFEKGRVSTQSEMPRRTAPLKVLRSPYIVAFLP